VNQIAYQITIDSRDIARITGKQHGHVCRDIARMLQQLKINQSKFGSVYLDAKNERRPCFRLPKREALILASGYDVVMRAAIIDRWIELETAQGKSKAPTHEIPQSYGEALLLAGKLQIDLEHANTTIVEQDRVLDAWEGYADQQELAISDREQIIDAQVPYVRAAQRLANIPGNMCVRDTAGTIRVREGILRSYLIQIGWLTRAKPRRATAYARRKRWMDVEIRVDTQNNRQWPLPVVTPVGRAILAAAGLPTISECMDY
jgi:phage antirepressor YoqD-like protein